MKFKCKDIIVSLKETYDEGFYYFVCVVNNDTIIKGKFKSYDDELITIANSILKYVLADAEEDVLQHAEIYNGDFVIEEIN